MTSESDRQKELEHRQRIQREVDLRLQEMEAKMYAPDAALHETVKHQPENSQEPWMKKVIFGGKLFALCVVGLVAVKIASLVAGFIIVAALGWMSYKLFFESKITNL